jgi:hypothetical protein
MTKYTAEKIEAHFAAAHAWYVDCVDDLMENAEDFEDADAELIANDICEQSAIPMTWSWANAYDLDVVFKVINV